MQKCFTNLYHQLEHGVALEDVALALRVAVLVHEVDQGLLGSFVGLLQTQSQGSQALVGLDHLVPRHSTGRPLVLHILHNSPHTLREFAHKVCGCWAAKEKKTIQIKR